VLENVEDQQPGNTEDSVSQLQPTVPGPSCPVLRRVMRRVALPVNTTSNLSCSMSPLCREPFLRRQERDRHELAHLPFFLHCPVAGCLWRGNRGNEFQKHWQQKDPTHHSGRKQYGCTPERSQIETFDPKEILDRIKNGAISLTEGQDQAILMVQVKSFELEKLDMMTHPWGRSRRQ
jgi:hypothetical protein